MIDNEACWTCEVELLPGEKLQVPSALIDKVGAGRWLITVQPVSALPVRLHDAFLNGYSPQDEGLYDACAGG